MEEDYSSEELSSDEELQAEFAKGSLSTGLIQRAVPPRTYTNNVAGLRVSLAALRNKELEWPECMDVTAHPPSTSIVEEAEETMNPEDDFKREMHFYQQALSSAVVGLRKLEELGIPTKRPEDYFAEMIKTDDHMRKVRQNLLNKQKFLEKKEKVRKLREQKKFGKKVQQDVLQKRREEKKASLEALKGYRKGKGKKPGFLAGKGEEEDDFPVAAHKSKDGKDKKMISKEKSKQRQTRDKKYGFGGKKRWVKSNTADSSADMSSFSSAKHSKISQRKRSQKGVGMGGGMMGDKKGRRKPVRLGKSRRQKMKLKR